MALLQPLNRFQQVQQRVYALNAVLGGGKTGMRPGLVSRLALNKAATTRSGTGYRTGTLGTVELSHYSGLSERFLEPAVQDQGDPRRQGLGRLEN